MTVVDKIAKQVKAEKIEHLENVLFTLLEAVWQHGEGQSYSLGLPKTEVELKVRAIFEHFVAEQALEDGATKDEFLQGMAASFDDVVAAEAADGEEEEEEEEEEEPGEEPAPAHTPQVVVTPGVAALQDALRQAPAINPEPPKEETPT